MQRGQEKTTEIENWERCNKLHHNSQAKEHLQATTNFAARHYLFPFSPEAISSE
jgi:hypothetical protein